MDAADGQMPATPYYADFRFSMPLTLPPRFLRHDTPLMPALRRRHAAERLASLRRLLMHFHAAAACCV